MKQQDLGPPAIRHKSSYLIWLVIGLSAVVLLVVGLAAGGGGPIPDWDVTVLERDWTDAAGTSVTLPLKRADQPTDYWVETTLPPEGESPRYLLFFAKYLNVRLLLDGEELGSCLSQPEGWETTRGKVFVLLPLPAQGGTLRLEAESLLGGNVPFELNAPRIGSGGALVHELIADELPMLAVTAAILCFGLFLLICGIQALHVVPAQGDSQTYQVSFLHIGLFALVFSLYSLTITESIYLFLPNSHLIYLMEFMLLALLPLPLLALGAKVCTPRFRILLTANCCALFLNVSIQALLHVVFGLDIREHVTVTHLLMVVSAVLLLFALVSAVRGENGQWWPLLSFSPVLAGALADIFRFYLPFHRQNVVGFQIGVLVFLLLQTAYLLRQNLSYYHSFLRSDTYRKMAYTDALTGLANRAAFEGKLSEVQEKPERYRAIWCVSADINNLKQTNDTLGHASGDTLIRDAARLLRSVADKNSPVYRIGGDEFVLLLFDWTEADVRASLDRLDAALEQHNRSHTPALSIAFGCDQFRFSEGDTVEKLLSRADSLMYEHKSQWKQERRELERSR